MDLDPAVVGAPAPQRRRPGPGDRAAARHRRGADARLDGRRGAGPHPGHRPRDVLEPQPRRSTGSRARPPATASGSRRSASTATATRCCSRSTRRARPATPARAPASTPTCSGRRTRMPRRPWLTAAAGSSRGRPRCRRVRPRGAGRRQALGRARRPGRLDARRPLGRPRARSPAPSGWSRWPAGASSWSPGAAYAVRSPCWAPLVAVGARRHRRRRPLVRARLGPRTRPSTSAATPTGAHTSPAGGGSALVGRAGARRGGRRGAVRARRGPRWAAGTTRPRHPSRRPEDMDDVDLWRAIDQGRDPDGPGRPLGCGVTDPADRSPIPRSMHV